MTDEQVTNEPLASLPARQEISLVDRLKAEIGPENGPDYVQNEYPVFSGLACVEEQLIEGDKTYSVVRYGESYKDLFGNSHEKSEPTGKRAIVPFALEWMPFSISPLRMNARIDTVGEEKTPVYVVELKTPARDGSLKEDVTKTSKPLFKYTLKI